jgi:hypothetical protein
MRTTIRMDDQLLREAKEYAARKGMTLTRLIEDAVRELLARSRQARVREPVCLPTFDGEGLQPGVDLDDTASLLDLMDAGDAPR